MAGPVLIERLPDGAADGDVIEIPMTAHDRRRVRRIVEAPDGARLALELATGTVLVPGQVLHRSGSRSYVVVALADAALADRLRRAGVPFAIERRAFQGRAPGEHAH